MAISETVGLIGVGRMGEAIGLRLLEQGMAVGGVAHRNRTRLDALVAAGACDDGDLFQTLARRETILVCVTSGAPLEAVMSALVVNLKPGQRIIDCSTGDPERTSHWAAIAKSRQAALIDAAILHSTPQTRAGNAVLLVGGADRDVDAVRGVLNGFARTVIHAGGPGEGQRLKLFSNALVHSMLALTAELAAHARSRGIDLDQLHEVFMAAGAASKVVDSVMKAARSGEHNPNAVIVNTMNAMKTYQTMARRQNAMTPVTDGAYTAYRMGVGSGLRDDPITRLVDALAEANERLKPD